jgi:hypothetical protein
MIKRCKLRRVRYQFGFVTVTLDGVTLINIRVEQTTDGDFTLKVPIRTNHRGRSFPSYEFDLETLQAVKAEIRRLWMQPIQES